MGGGEECDVQGYVGDFVGCSFEEAGREGERGELKGCGEDDCVEGFFVGDLSAGSGIRRGGLDGRLGL